ncbi:hypothetical protein ABKV19_026920 [Rosa sericea]
MEPAKIDWKNLEWRFVEDKAYEQINAPKWFDFLNPNDNLVDDHAWFCTPECNHPKTAEDFLRSSPFKVPSPSDVSGVSPLGDKFQRDVKLKRRGLTSSSVHPTNNNSRFKEDGENQNPNLSSTPPNYQAKAMKEAIKSSTEKKQPCDTAPQNSEVLPRLKSTLSARNLFAGKEILNQITDFCSELKRMATTRAKEREEVEKGVVNNKEEEVMKQVESNGELNGRERERMPLLELGKGKTETMVKEEECNGEVGSEVNGKQRERMPLMDANKGKTEGFEGRILKEGKRIKKRVDNAENIPVSLNLESVKRKGGEDLLQIRTNPPSPQCFSATRPPNKITPSKALKSKLMEKGGIVQGQTNKQVIATDDSKQVITKDDSKQVITKDESTEKAKSVYIADGKEARTLDVFWFLKPCTLST